MATINLPVHILESLNTVLLQLQHSLPAIKNKPTFDAYAYKWQDGQLHAIHQLKSIHLSDLKGIERQKEKVIQNTLQFLNGLPANDILLTGSRGTGKSSIVRALLNDYAEQGLRLIEIERDDLSDLPQIQKLIADRPEKFIVYCDDLAFNAEDENYRSLKSVLDGSLQSGSSNFVIYATSNRRHLLPEFMHENTPATKVDVPQYTELHPQEAIEEKISLSDRFGLWLSFYPMDQNLYLEIVEHYLNQAHLELSPEARAEALRWCQSRGQRSGRAAYQFSKHWIGAISLKALEQSIQ
ncbi:AAA family ATPase [Acinetobacter sp. NCu2D-2]|uniref:ATP-binding protein n=1 Tax=Acinetobacter sp. NCu2D-2 TaxID=1608473 RepID=UPI0007CDE8C0|nr:ATP-binding protein [Acinetobacter sp. NCu2D-2]ANF81556.1 AAA family ATPase [Acinetobacter sp. NCu2D-2]